MKLIYINSLDKNFRGQNIYEFLFANDTEIEYGENWDAVPASAADITPPPIAYISSVSTLTTDEIEIECVQYSDSFSVIDAVDTIIALGWESIPVDGIARLVFHFGETLESVKEKLYARDLEIVTEKISKYST